MLCLALGVTASARAESGARSAPSTTQPERAEWTPAEAEELPPHHLRSVLEMGAGLALGSTGYWLLMDRNIADWDNPRPEARFDGSAWVLDNNSLAINFLGHPLSGGLSYSFARANHQSVAGAFGYSFLTSFLWEFLLEFKEKVSINDTIATPGMGLPIGEFFFKLGQYLDTGAGRSLGVDVARWTLGTGVALDRRLDGRPAPYVKARDTLGFTSSIWHDFSLRYGTLLVTTPGEHEYARYAVRLSGRLVTLPGYLRARAGSRAFHGAEISDFSASIEASRFGSGLDLGGDTQLAGYHWQRLRAVEREVRGEALTLATSVGFRYFRSSADHFRSVEQAVSQPEPDLKYHVPNERAQYAALHLPGLAADLQCREPWGSFELRGRLQPSLGGLGAAAFYDYTAAHPDAISKHILHRQGYFYGWGGAAQLSAGLSLGPVRAGFELSYAAYESVDGWDRHPEQLTTDVHARGDVLQYSGSVGIAPAGTPLSVSLDLGVRRFRSQVEDFERTARLLQRGVRGTWVF